MKDQKLSNVLREAVADEKYKVPDSGTDTPTAINVSRPVSSKNCNRRLPGTVWMNDCHSVTFGEVAWKLVKKQ